MAEDGAKQTLLELGIEDDAKITEQVFTSAKDWATKRSAELVGKSWGEDGNLVDNPDAEMAITDATRDDIREAVAQALEDGDSAAELGETIEGLGAFSEARAEMIARTEIIRAHGQGQLAAMRDSGVVERKAWSTAEDDDVSEECEANADQGGIDLDDAFDSGDDAPPAHPNCRCALVAYFPEEREEDEDEQPNEGEDSEED
ncbi:MAG TPA: phage minor head protein [Polyangiaceae bacterium]|nr:phage minor head protein [Polyangiaceae bacterium]